MLKKISGALVVVFVLLAACLAVAADNHPLQVGRSLPEMELPVPADSENLRYLGLRGGKVFQVGQIKAKVVIIQIYSMYCPYCQAEAPNVNRLYGAIEGNPTLKDKIKIVGIGAGNTPFEVGTYKRKYNVPFPLIPDADFKIHRILGEVRTPYFIAAKITDGGRTEIVYSRLGVLGDVNVFLEQLTKLSPIL